MSALCRRGTRRARPPVHPPRPPARAARQRAPPRRRHRASAAARSSPCALYVRASLKHELRPLRVVVWPGLDRQRVVARGCRECVEREGTIARLSERDPSLRRQGCRVLPGGTRIVEGSGIVVGEQLRVVFDPAERLIDSAAARCLSARRARGSARRPPRGRGRGGRIFRLAGDRRRRSRRTNSLRSRAWSRSSSRHRSPPSAPSQNVLPTAAASWSSSFSSADSVSSRAAMMPWTSRAGRRHLDGTSASG